MTDHVLELERRPQGVRSRRRHRRRRPRCRRATSCSPSSGRAGAGSRRCCASSPGWSTSTPARSASATPSSTTAVRRVDPERRHIGLVFQEHALFPHLTVADNVAFGLRDLSRADRADALRRVARRRRPRRPRRPLPARAVGRRAPAGRAGPGPGPAAAPDAARRAVRQPRPEPPRPAAHRDRRRPAPDRDAGGVRHPRPDRGADDRRPRGRHAGRTHRAARPARRGLPPPRQPLRRRVHGRGGVPARRRRSAGPSSARCPASR